MKIEKFNEFVNNDKFINEDELLKLIEDADTTPFADLEKISQGESYIKVVSIGEKVIPYLLDRSLVIWDRALSEITGDGLDPLKYSSLERKQYWENWGITNGYKK